MRKRSAQPLIRLAVGVGAALGGYLIHPALGVAVAAIALVWILLGFSAVIADAAAEPETPVAAKAEPPRAAKPRDTDVECPKCSLFVPRDAAACTCGWVVPSDAA